ncbi:MAG TPA: PP2C family protein-serine/threonine phosphatase [Thermoanaerobaculia bacterium]|nr:PP2C family protein-serine/threonine phosphatase [Thermoanaerobaculia bacterium]
MPERSTKWSDLFRSTFHDVGREDIVGLYSLEWRRAKEKLTVDDREAIDREPRRWKRWFKTANSVLFGLAVRLAPARRVIFLVVLACWFLTLFAPSCEKHESHADENGRRGVSYRVDFDSGFLTVSSVLLLLLLAMELVDKINYRDELELARELQASLIPRVLPEVPGFSLGAHNEIANMVGGDIYDFVPLKDGRLAVLFGDASGHGMAAGLVMAVAHAAFRTQLEVDAAPEAMFATLNRILCRTGSPRAFFGAVYLLVSPDGSLAGAVAGHPPALRVGPDGFVRERLGAGAYPLGIKTDLAWPVLAARLEAGETLLLHSDGLSEARNPRGDEFGDARIESAIRHAAALSPQELVDALAVDVTAFRGEESPEDDISVAAIRRA